MLTSTQRCCSHFSELNIIECRSAWVWWLGFDLKLVDECLSTCSVFFHQTLSTSFCQSKRHRIKFMQMCNSLKMTQQPFDYPQVFPQWLLFTCYLICHILQLVWIIQNVIFCSAPRNGNISSCMCGNVFVSIQNLTYVTLEHKTSFK